MNEISNAILDACKAYPDAKAAYPVQGRGRPERQPVEAAIKTLSRIRFGQYLRGLRKSADMTLHAVALAAGITSARKLAQYETTCYPPGEALKALAPVYGVELKELSFKLLEHSDPVLYEGITGNKAFRPTNEEIQAYIQNVGSKPN